MHTEKLLNNTSSYIKMNKLLDFIYIFFQVLCMAFLIAEAIKSSNIILV